MGARIPGLGRSVVRQRGRRYASRVFAELAAWVLDVDCYDTQCGAKLFRAHAELREVFAKPFSVAWSFDVELLARMKTLAGRGPLWARVYELPLAAWREVPGSRLRLRDFPRALGELARIRRRYP